jgi:hypothetical protein
VEQLPRRPLVERHDDLLALGGLGQNGGIAWVGRPAANRLDVVSGIPQRGCRRTGDARLDQDLHRSPEV